MISSNSKKKLENFVMCSDCYFWGNRKNSRFNKLHVSIQECSEGQVVSSRTRACNKYTIKKPLLNRRR